MRRRAVSVFENRLDLLNIFSTNNNSSSISIPKPHSLSSTMTTADDAAAYGFDRPEMHTASLANTVDFYQRHLFLCYKNPDTWPPKVESYADADAGENLPKLLFSALKSRKDLFPLKTRLTVCGGCEGTEFSDGDVLIFPEMVKYKGLKESDVDEFVDDVLVNGKTWTSGGPESLVGAYVFVCAHASRDKRCGVCGPALIEKFKEEIEKRALSDNVFVNSCSHIGGHKYAGNVIIFGTNAEGKVTGDWYGYVTPDDVPELVDVHIDKGEIIKKLWRGQMGLKVEATEKDENKALEEVVEEKTVEKPQESVNEVKENTNSCCQAAAGVSCCRDDSAVNGEVGGVNQDKSSEKACKKGMTCGWMGKWEQSDVLMAAGIVGAVAIVAVAYSFVRRPS